MDTTTVQNLNIPITYFDTLDQMKTEWALAGFSERDRNIFLERFQGVCWQETTDHHFVYFPAATVAIKTYVIDHITPPGGLGK